MAAPPPELELHKPIAAADRDEKSPVWDMSQERVFIEQLLNQRFNFFLVLFSLVIAGAANSRSQFHLQAILSLGALICVLIAAVLRRSQEKLDLILEDLFSDPSHPAGIIDRRATQTTSKRKIIGIYIPSICCIVLVLRAGAAIFRILVVQ